MSAESNVVTNPQPDVANAAPSRPNAIQEFLHGLELNSRIALGGSAVVVLASFLTWIGASIGEIAITFSGVRTSTGLMSLLAGIAFAAGRIAPQFLPALKSKERIVHLATLIAASITAVLVLWFIIRAGKFGSYGAWVSLAGHAALLYGAVQQWRASGAGA